MSNKIAKAAERLIEANEKLRRQLTPAAEEHNIRVALAEQIGELARLVRNIANER